MVLDPPPASDSSSAYARLRLHDDQDRCRYWTTQMDLAFEFMQTVRKQRVRDCGEVFASLPKAADDAGVEVKFSAKKHVDGLDRQFYIRTGLITPFINAARQMNDRGWIMRIEDGFRDRRMQARLSLYPIVFEQIMRQCVWESQDVPLTSDFVFKRLAAMIAFCPAVGTHMSGSAIDISVMDRCTGNEVDRGGAYIELSELTPMNSPFISDEARHSRQAISAMMQQHGFIAYPWEFWHYSGGDVYAAQLTDHRQHARYGPVDWDPAHNSVTPIRDAGKPLNSLQVIRKEIETFLASNKRMDIDECRGS